MQGLRGGDWILKKNKDLDDLKVLIQVMSQQMNKLMKLMVLKKFVNNKPRNWLKIITIGLFYTYEE